MGESDFREQVMKALNDLNKSQAVLANDMTAIRASLEERCPARGLAIAKVQQDVDALWAREHKRSGGTAVIMGMLGASSVIGGVVAKILPFGG